MTFLDKITVDDFKTLVAGAVAWALAIPPVMIAGNAVVATDGTNPKDLVVNKIIALVVGVGISGATTPALSYVMGWTSPSQKVRGIALALGAAQTIDGLVHIFYPAFYSSDPSVGLGCAGNVFLGAGLLGIFSAYA